MKNEPYLVRGLLFRDGAAAFQNESSLRNAAPDGIVSQNRTAGAWLEN